MKNEKQKEFKAENLNENSKKEEEMARRRHQKKRSRSNRRRNFIDGWGLILLIIGIALFLLREDIKIIGGIIALIGFIRIIYVLAKYG